MKKLLSTKYSAGAFNTATFILRLTLGALLIMHGYDKLMHINDNHDQFASIFGLSKNISFYLSVFAEFFCSLLIILGLFTRLAAITLIINMTVALGKAHHWDFSSAQGEKAGLFLGGFIVILLLGAGKASIDGMISK